MERRLCTGMHCYISEIMLTVLAKCNPKIFLLSFFDGHVYYVCATQKSSNSSVANGMCRYAFLRTKSWKAYQHDSLSFMQVHWKQRRSKTSRCWPTALYIRPPTEVDVLNRRYSRDHCEGTSASIYDNTDSIQRWGEVAKVRWRSCQWQLLMCCWERWSV